MQLAYRLNERPNELIPYQLRMDSLLASGPLYYLRTAIRHLKKMNGTFAPLMSI